jgi:hypothetical protein
MQKTTFLLLLALSYTSVFATTYYVSPTGSSSNSGTISSPLSFSAAIGKSLVAGDSVILRGGTYNFNSTVSFSKSGSAGNLLHIVAYKFEVPIFDFRTTAYGNRGFTPSGNYIHLKGIIFQGSGKNGLYVSGSNNFIEHCTTRWNGDSGFQMKTGSDNYILNCDSYENFDYETGGISAPNYGGNSDGFADKQYTNTGTNTYKGCRSWRNGDDGWDSYEKVGNTVYDSCWCYSMAPASFDMTDNIRFKTDSASWFYQFKNSSGRYVVPCYGNGNGFKMGGNYTTNNATAHHCISVGNLVKGFDQNNNNGTMTVYNCTSYNNGNNYGYSNSSYGTLIIKNCASLSSKGSNSFNCKSVTQAYNSWNSGFNCAESDFVSLDYFQMLNDRKPDGSLPEITLLHLTATSNLIDKGTNLGYSFVGTAPDLGAFEYSGGTTAIEPIGEPNSGIRVYLSSNKNFVVAGAIAYVEIYNLAGEKEFSQRVLTNNLSISAANLAKGISLVRVILQNGNATTKKLLIE